MKLNPTDAYSTPKYPHYCWFQNHRRAIGRHGSNKGPQFRLLLVSLHSSELSSAPLVL
jgi:hypothetical protein